ncbi:MAG: hypothetical protein K9H16_04255 [Bacteroidales bacterium]|nr:hypothetical protein [Bacteroidales bacterium]
MMKKLFISLAIAILIAASVQAQEAEALLGNASSEYKSGNLENARFNLQQMLQEINQAIGRDILALLPDNLQGMTKVDEEDNVTGVNAGFAGLFVTRNYKTETHDASIEIVSDSPLLGGLNLLLNMPVFIASDPNQKKIKIDGQKALLTKNTGEDGSVNYNVQLAFGSTLFTFNCNGFEDEKDVTGMLDNIPIKDIMAVAQ